jgi:hypothetical protein
MEEDNRFLRVYREHKDQEGRVNTDNRFECLRDTYSTQDSRFDCLKDNTVKYNNDITNKFSCLVDDNYINNRYSPREAYSPRLAPYSPRQEPYSPRSAPYSPRQEPYSPRQEPYSPKESVNTIARRISEERRLTQKPKLSFDSNYHFPELSPISTKSRGLSIDDFKLPDAIEVKKEMITNTYITPVIQETVTKMFLGNGKAICREVAIDGSEIVNKVVVKKNTYNSWASVIKSEADKVITYEQVVSD